MIKCPNCGGVLNYNVKEKQVKCEHCGSSFDPKEKIAPTKKAGESNDLEGKVYTCSQCGASLMNFDETAITFCSYCGSQAMIESKMMVQTKPDYIIPFSKTKEECIEIFKRKVNKSLFVPNYMKSDLVLQKFRGIYMPYCIYKLSYSGPKKEKGSKYSHRSGDYQYYDDYTIEFDVDAKYEGLSYDLSSKLYDRYSRAIPFDDKEKEEFNPNYLLGFYADTKDVSGDIYLNEAIITAVDDYSDKLLSMKEVRKYGCSSGYIDFKDVEQKVGMYPLYFLAIRSKDQKNVNYAIVNGQTGELVTELPVSYSKYIVASLIIAAIIFVLINSGLVLNPKEVCAIASGFAIIGLIINIIQNGKLKNRETHADDKGIKSVKKDKDKIKRFSAVTFLILVLAVVIPLVVLASGLVRDIYYYGSALISLGLLLITFYGLLKKHNELLSTKLPQLEKRGGDESE